MLGRAATCFATPALLLACAGEVRHPARGPCNDPAARAVVERFGDRLKLVSLQAPESLLGRELRDAYADVVTPQLLQTWFTQPAAAPGRLTSSPWPERIDVESLRAVADSGAECIVTASVAYLTSTEAAGAEVQRRTPVTLRVRRNGTWRISAVDWPVHPATDSSQDALAAADVIRRYVAAIGERNYGQAYALWVDEGRGSGQTLDEFVERYAATVALRATLGQPSRVEPAAGSRYVDIPVDLYATTTAGTTQHFRGSFVLRRSVVPGAAPNEQRWRIYAAKLR